MFSRVKIKMITNVTGLTKIKMGLPLFPLFRTYTKTKVVTFTAME